MAFLGKHIPSWTYQLMLVLAAAIWGLGTVVIKDTVDTIPPFWLVGLRFISAGALLSLALLPRMVRVIDAAHLKAGCILGVFVALTYLLNTTGLVYTTASKSSFLTATYCVLAPFLTWLLMRKKPTAFNLVAAVVCLAGIGFVALSSGAENPTSGAFTPNLGDGLTLLSALTCGIHIVLVAKFAPGRDMMVLTALQFLVAGAIGCIWAAANGAPPAMEALLNPETAGSLAYLVVCATCATLLLQNIGLAHVDPAPASLLLSTEAVFGVVFSVAFLGEALTAHMLTGFSLIFAAVLISEWLPLTPWCKRKQVTERNTR